MGKKYLETKNNSLESSVIGVWKTAAGEGESIRDAAQMTKAESKLDTGKLPSMKDALRQVRFGKEVGLDEGSVIFDDHDTDDEDFKALTKKLRLKVKTKGDETTVSGSDANVSKMLKTMRMKKDSDGHAVLEEVDLDEAKVNPKDREELDTAPSDTAKKIKRALEPAPNQMVEASGDKEAYKKFFDAALKKFKASSPADLKGDQKKKFFDYIDANWEGDNEKAEGAMSQVREYKIQSMKAALAKVWGLGEGLEDSPNPANKQHLCAKNVVHEEWGSGNCVPTQHANPDEEGNIAWYDVMFEHGIEKEVSADNLKIIEEEMHSHSSSYDPKKKMKKEVTKTATGKKAAVIDVNPKIKD